MTFHLFGARATSISAWRGTRITAPRARPRSPVIPFSAARFFSFRKIKKVRTRANSIRSSWPSQSHPLAAQFPELQSVMQPALASAEQKLSDASKSALELDRVAAAKSLEDAGKQIASLRDAIAKQQGAGTTAALWELDQIRARINNALVEDVALPVNANADRHELVAGESFSVALNFPDKPAVPATWTVDNATLKLPRGWTPKLADAKEGSRSYRFDVAIPADAKPSNEPAYAVLPFPPPLVKVALRVKVDDYEFTVEEPVDSMEAKTTGILTYPLELVPAVTLTVEQPQIMVPAKRASDPVTLLARVRYHGANAAKVSVGFDAPKEWTPQPVAPLDFSAPGDRLIRLTVKPTAGIAPGAYPLHPFAKFGERGLSHVTRTYSDSANARLERAG